MNSLSPAKKGLRITITRTIPQLISAVSKVFRVLGLARQGLPAAPMIDLFRIHQGVYCGGIYMSKNTNWEMHIDGDETLTLTSGRIELVLQENGGETRMVLTDGQSAVIPAGIWHRQIVEIPGELLFMTFGDTTEHRPFRD